MNKLEYTCTLRKSKSKTKPKTQKALLQIHIQLAKSNCFPLEMTEGDLPLCLSLPVNLTCELITSICFVMCH